MSLFNTCILRLISTYVPVSSFVSQYMLLGVAQKYSDCGLIERGYSGQMEEEGEGV